MFGLFGKKTATVRSKSDPTVYRSYLSPDELVTLPAGDEVQTMGDIFAYTVCSPSVSVLTPGQEVWKQSRMLLSGRGGCRRGEEDGDYG